MSSTRHLAPLPVDEHLPEIMRALAARPNHILVAEPGAGKTTRLPPAMLEAAFARDGEILVLEPRRLAARLAARRVADEAGKKLGREIGYRVRFDDKTSDQTRLCFVTEGILARRLATDPGLDSVTAVILDEFHERHLDGDLCLAWLRRLQIAGHPLRIIVMSATLDAAPLAEYLDAPVTRVAGRAYPVEVEYQPREDARPLAKQVAGAVRGLVRASSQGDVLVFLPGAAEIRRAREACKAVAESFDLELAVLHGDLPLQEQERAVRGAKRRRVILSTNVAESSVTLPGVVAVVDSGLARVARHSPWSGLPTLTTAKISQASAVQRAGRAGRLGPGRCVRLYTAHDFKHRPLHDEAEVARADLVTTALFLYSRGERPAEFPFFEMPKPDALKAASELLQFLGATDPKGSLTAMGKEMLALPVHPRQARLALSARDAGVGARGCLMAALLGEREIRREVRTRFDSASGGACEVGASDLIACLERFEAAEWEGGGRDAWRRHDLDPAATQAVRRVRDQLSRKLRVDVQPCASLEEEEEALLRATLSAFPDRVGRRRVPGGNDIVFAGGGAANQAPSSVVREAEFLVGVDVGERAGRGRAIRMASQIDPEWLLELYPDHIHTQDTVEFDAETEQVIGHSRLLYRALLLDESTNRGVGGEAARCALVEAALQAGFGRFCDEDDLASLRARAAFALTHGGPELDLSEGVLRRVLTEAAEGCRGFAELRRMRPLSLLKSHLGQEALRRLDRFAPRTIILGAGREVSVIYEEGKDPRIASRLQDFFGLEDGPRVAGGRVALVLHLLAPNRRAVQVTTDLAGFWERHYPELRRALMRRYSRHAWPEDPKQAVPTRGGLRARSGKGKTRK